MTSTGIFTTDADIGAPSPAGSSSYTASTDTYTVAGGGADIQGASDQFNYLYKTVNGDATLIARVTGEQNTNAWAKAGVMFRNSNAAGDMEASMIVSYSSGVSFQWRSSSGGSTSFAETTGVSALAWVELVRSGNTFTAYYATTTAEPTSGQWIQVGSPQTIAMGTAAIGGLCVTSHNNGTLNTATFTGVQITGAATATNAPVMTAAATASPNIVTGTTTGLSASAIDDSGLSGKSSLTYAWSPTGTPPGNVSSPPMAPMRPNRRSPRSAQAARTAGRDDCQPQNQSVTSSVNVTVNQTLTSIAVSPPSVSLNAAQTQQFTATALDQFGTAMATQPTFTWSTTAGTIGSSSGLLTASQSSVSGTVTATSGGISGSSTVTVTDHPPTASNVTATPSPVTGSTTTLSVTGADSDTGAGSLSYTWVATAYPPRPRSPYQPQRHQRRQQHARPPSARRGPTPLRSRLRTPADRRPPPACP